jgi:hypothetical protein
LAIFCLLDGKPGHVERVTGEVQQLFNNASVVLNLEQREAQADHCDNRGNCSTTLYVPLPVFAAHIVFAAETKARTLGKKLKHSEFRVVRTGIPKHPEMLS